MQRQLPGILSLARRATVRTASSAAAVRAGRVLLSVQHARRATAVAVVAAGAVALHVCSEAEASPRIHDDYVLGSFLGTGAFAVVKSGVNRKTGQKVAIKIIPKTKSNADSLRREVETLQRMSLHTNVANLEAFYEDAHHFYIVMEFVSGGDMLDFVSENGALSEPKAAALLSELSGALALLHAQHACHGDLKPENLLLTDDGHLKLVDFGLSCELAEGPERKSMGSAQPPPPTHTLQNIADATPPRTPFPRHPSRLSMARAPPALCSDRVSSRRVR